MDRDLERFVKICNLKFRLKSATKSLGFEDKNNVLFTKENNDYELNVKFDDTEMILWNNKNPNKRISRYYSIILKDVEDGIYEEKEFIEGLLKLL